MSNESADDYAAYTDTPDSGVKVDLSQLQDMAERQEKAQAEVERLEAELKTAQKAFKKIAEEELPELMDQVGLSDFKTRSGLKIVVDEVIRASIPAARKFEAFTWLTTNNSEALIKRYVSVPFGKGETDKAKELETYLLKQGYAAENEASVHPNTLSSWVKEKLTKGVEIPLELFGVFRQRVAKITKPK